MRVTRSTPAANASPAALLNSRRATRMLEVEKEREAIIAAGDNVVSVAHGELSIVSLLDRLPREKREKRHGDHVHVSDLLGKCIRKIAICDREAVAVAPDRLTVSDKLTYAQGDAIHDVIKNMATLSDPRQVWGKWSCKCGHLYHDEPCTHSLTDPNDICPQCETPTNHYHEVGMYDDELMIVGHPDLLRWIRTVEAFHVTEVKSMVADQWAELSRPIPLHVMQVLFYWYIMKKNGYRMTDVISIVYVSKGYMFKGKPYKEYLINAVSEVHRLEPYLEYARALVAAKNAGPLPQRVTCSGENSPAARKCECAQLCFSME